MHHSNLTEMITPYNSNAQLFYEKMSSLGFNNTQTSMLAAQKITEQGFIIGANEIFWLSAVMFLLLVIVVWFAKPPFGSDRKK